MADGGLIDKRVAYKLPLRKDWKEKHTEQIKKELVENRLFLTNIVKCCYDHSKYPERNVIASQIGLLVEEITIVKPQRIIAFGGLVQKTLKKLFLNVPITPCYFPIGRGRPREAGEILSKLA